MSFTPEEIARWHKERKSVSDKIEADRLRERETARRANAVAVCVHCGNPFGFGEGHISDDVEICYVCLDWRFPTDVRAAYAADVDNDSEELGYVMLAFLLAGALVHGFMSGLLAL